MKIIATTPFKDQRPGTSGLRKKTRVFQQPHYVENFVQSVFNAIKDEHPDLRSETLVVGGDGRYYNRNVIQIILKMAAANGFGKVKVALNGILSTPAMSAVIRRHQSLGGIVLSASHNPGGIDADFGIKYNIRNGGPSPEPVTELIYKKSLEIQNYSISEHSDIDIDHIRQDKIENTEISIFDSLQDYVELMQQLFDFDRFRDLFRSGFRMLFDAMHGVTGPYAHHIFEKLLGAANGTVMNGTPLEDFGGHHPDPNLVYAADLVRMLNAANAPDFGAACDGDGDRNMILGRNFFITPGDSLAMIAEYAVDAIPGYRKGLSGVARSMPTSTAVDRVAASLSIPCHETPTGWKFFGNLMDANMCTICGEESFGTGSNHIREKDGMWAVLSWLSIVAKERKSVAEIAQNHWKKFGRSYFQRHDYEALDSATANAMLDALRSKLSTLQGTSIAESSIRAADDFQYTDPVDGSHTSHQGIRILLQDGSRIVCRLSGTGTEGATLRIYLERYRTADFDIPVETMLAPLAEAASQLLELQRWTKRNAPTVIT